MTIENRINPLANIVEKLNHDAKTKKQELELQLMTLPIDSDLRKKIDEELCLQNAIIALGVGSQKFKESIQITHSVVAEVV